MDLSGKSDVLKPLHFSHASGLAEHEASSDSGQKEQTRTKHRSGRHGVDIEQGEVLLELVGHGHLSEASSKYTGPS